MARRRARAANPFTLWMQGLEASRLVFEAQAVMGMRVLGAMGLWNTPASEHQRMVAEKGPAFASAVAAGGAVLLAGGDAASAMRAAARPLKRRTSANLKRLSRRGPAA